MSGSQAFVPRRIWGFLFLLSLAFLVGGVVALRRTGPYVRLVASSVGDFQAVDPAESQPPGETEFFRSELAAAGLGQVRGDGPRVLFVLRWLSGQVHRVELDSNRSARQALENARRGGGLACGSMAKVFVAAVRSVGYRAREVQLVRSLLNQRDTHVTAEVFLDGHWRVVDPTFNVTYERDGANLSASDLHEALLHGRLASVHPVFHGSTAYPARLESYYMDWGPFYNNVMICQTGASKWARLPPFRYWLGPRWVCLENGPIGLWGYLPANTLYFFVTVFLPFITGLFGLGWLLGRPKG